MMNLKKTKMMKNKVALIISLFFLTTATYAQEVNEQSGNIDKVSGTVLRTTINRAEEKTIVKGWKGVMKDYDADVDTKNNGITAKEVKIESIGTVGLEVLAEVRKSSDTQKEFIVMFLKNGTAISSTSDLSAFTAAKSIVREFANNMSKKATEDYQKAQIKLFDDIEDDYEDAQKEQEKAEKDIEDAKEQIKESEKEIKEKSKFLDENKRTQADLKKKMEAQKTMVNGSNKEMDLFK